MLSILMYIYQWVMLGCDFVYFIMCSAYLVLETLWHMFSPPPLKTVVGEVILITGTGHGIGKQLALQFSRLGAKVVCLDADEVNNNKTVISIISEGGTAWGYTCDVSNRECVKQVAIKVQQEIGEITVLVNNAEIMPCKSFLKHTPEEIEKLFSINILSHFWTLKEFLPPMLKSGQGHVIAVSSIAGVMATSNLVPYCSSKFAVKGLMEGLVEELRYGGQHPNIKVTCVHPFFFDNGLAKNPRIRFPSINPITSPERCAELIIQGMRKDHEEIFIPSKDSYGIALIRLLPRKVRKAFLDFMDTGVDDDYSGM
ncbi:estradiol 17-beta-dehydrogenase 11-like isoform X2 [Oratosquilla oratoria]